MNTVRLGDVAHVGGPREKPSPQTEVSFVGMAQLDAESAEAIPRESLIFGEVSSGYTIFNNGDILVAKITPCWENGKIGKAVLAHAVGVGSSEFHVIHPKSGLVSQFLLHFLRQSWIREAGELRMTGSGGQRRVPLKFLADLQIPLPPVPEQCRIAAILDQADSLRAKRRQVLAHVNSLPHSIFREVFGQAAWTATIAEIADIQIGPFGSLLHQSDYISDGVPVVNPMHIVDSRIVPDSNFCISADKAKELQRYRLEIGDVVLGRRGLMGRAGIVQSDQVGALCGTGSIILRPREINSRLLHSIVVSPVMKKYLDDHSRGTTLPNLNSKIVAGAPAPVRDRKSEESFSAKLQTVEIMAERAGQAETANDELFASLQSRAFRGEL